MPIRAVRALDEKMEMAALLGNHSRLAELDGHLVDYFEFIDRHADLLYRASPYWVSPDLSQLVGVAFATIPSDFVLAPHHFPTRSGFVLFDHDAPLVLPSLPAEWERDDDQIKQDQDRDRLLSDVVDDDVLALDLDGYDDLRAWDEEDEIAAEHGPPENRLPTDIDRVHAIYWEHDGTNVLCGFVPRKGLYRVEHYTMQALSVLMNGEEFVLGHSLADVRWSVSYMAAFLLLAGERLTTTTLQPPSRPERRRAQRAGEPPPPDTRIVTLRAVDSQRDEPGDEPGNYDYRWLVRGHWHRYWKGPVGEQRLEPQWVGPYVKGPDDKPLRVHTGELFKVSR